MIYKTSIYKMKFFFLILKIYTNLMDFFNEMYRKIKI